MDQLHAKRLDKWRIYAAYLSFCLGITIMGLKYLAYSLSGSTALLSDALESLVNVVAAGFALFAIYFAQEPPDREHPYGHGKIEFITAVFEGGLISFAALLIFYESYLAVRNGFPPVELGLGLWVNMGAGIINGLLGFFLIKVGKKTDSLALQADGQHVFSDFLTSLAMLVGLLVVKFTHYYWLDSVIAILMGVLLLVTGIPLIKTAVNGLLDAENPTLLEKIRASTENLRDTGIIRIHHVRAMRNGRRIHVDGHVVVPEHWTVQFAHDYVEKFERKVVKTSFMEGEIGFHIDPCRRLYCSLCELKDCPIRKEKFISRPNLSLEEMVSPFDRTDSYEV